MAKWAKMTSQIGNMYLRLDKDLDKSVPTPIILKIFLKHSPMQCTVVDFDLIQQLVNLSLVASILHTLNNAQATRYDRLTSRSSPPLHRLIRKEGNNWR